MKRFLVLVCLASLSIFSAGEAATAKTWKLGDRIVPGPLPPRPDAPAPELEKNLNVIYGQADGQLLELDFAKPVLCRDQKVPLVVYVHGGGWRSGDKAGAFEIGVIRMGFQLGFAVASLNYRLAPKSHFPAQIQDCKLAIRYLRKNAEAYGIDSSRIAVAGGSAGGHLSALLGTTVESDGLEGPGLEGISTRVLAVVDQFGPADLTDTSSQSTAEGISMLTDFLGCNPYGCIEKAALASPVTYVRPGNAPFLIIHGDKDTLVPYRQSELLAERLRRAGNACALIKVRNAEHGLIPSPLLAALHPSFDAVSFMSAAHLARFLDPGAFGDLNLDGRRNYRDFQELRLALGLIGVGPQGTPAADYWNPLADLVPDGIIDVRDVQEFIRIKR